MKSRTFVALLLSVSLMMSLGPSKALAKKYPRRPITLICPWGAGGGTDAVSRILATLLKQELGVPVNVVNRTGGSGAVGHTVMATARLKTCVNHQLMPSFEAVSPRQTSGVLPMRGS